MKNCQKHEFRQAMKFGFDCEEHRSFYCVRCLLEVKNREELLEVMKK